MNDQYLLDELEEKIIDTVSSYMSKNLKGERPVILLSGGFDSGLLAVLTEPEGGYRIHMPFGVKYDESRYADDIADHLNLYVSDVPITKELFIDNFPDAVRAMGEVVPHFSLVPLYILFKELKREGVEHVLSGEGPDEYLGGYSRQVIFDELLKLYQIPELRNFHGMINKVIGKDLVLKYAELMKYPYADVRYYIDLYAAGTYPLQGVLGKMDMELGVIEKMEQKLANHFGITLHYPYIDEKLAEYCYKLPDNLKIRNGVTKWGFKQIAMKYLPEIMRHRLKMGGPVFPVNQVMGWMEDGEFDKTRYMLEQTRILKNETSK